ncbi:T9SS type A sorting domain-containing protein [Sporocytophaga myxococcoides]|uniref:T9SS type A sorting domain-containing protein n=1 Tax=Sporocytophaga myxococcoides TaxID=153721 RepID=UPI00040BBCEC|nr:T9SS type A sorting domain-containing protein [Sporocytophaga myxococcoides]
MRVLLLTILTSFLSLSVSGQWVKLTNPTTYQASFLLNHEDKVYASIGGGITVGDEEQGHYRFYKLELANYRFTCATKWNKHVVTGSSNGFVALYGDISIAERLFTKSISSGEIYNIEITGGRVLFATQTGIFISDDVLNTVQRTTAGIPKVKVGQVKIINDKIYAASDSGLYVSENSGDNWKLLAFPRKKVNSVEFANDTIYVGAKAGLIFSTDEGKSWTPVLSFENKEVNKIFVDQSDLWLTSGYHTFKKVNGDWQEQYTGLPGEVISMVRAGNTIFLSSVLGIVSKKDGGEWMTAKLDNGGDKRELSALASDGKHLIAGTVVGGVYLSKDFGNSWEQKSPPVDPSATINNLHINNKGWFAGNYMNTFRSQDSAKTWALAQQGLASGTFSYFKSFNDSIWAYSSVGLYLSLDQGDNWSQFLPAASSGLVKNSKGDILFASGQNLLKAPYPYTNWDTVTFSKNLTRLEQAGDTMYLGTVGDYLYRSFDGGSTWEKIFKGLNISNANIYELTVSKEYAVTSIENVIYVLRHNNDQWTTFNQGLPFEDIRELMILNNDLYTVVQFQGLYRRSLSDFEEPTSIDQPGYEKASDFYPNPAVNYIHLKNSSGVEQTGLYDLSGKLINSFDASDVIDISSIEKGIYIIRITYKDKTETFERLIKY